MNPSRPPITANLKVSELLDAYPELEQVLMDFAPPFRKLRNPVLRRTIARVTTLARAAQVADVPIVELIRTLQRAAGLVVTDAALDEPPPVTFTASPDAPAWLKDVRLVLDIDADATLATGEHPLAQVQQAIRTAGPDQAVCIRGSFRPVPLIELMRQQGCEVHVIEEGPQSFRTVIRGKQA